MSTGVKIILTCCVVAILILIGPELFGYHHCGTSDYLFGARHAIRFFGQNWCQT